MPCAPQEERKVSLEEILPEREKEFNFFCKPRGGRGNSPKTTKYTTWK